MHKKIRDQTWKVKQKYSSVTAVEIFYTLKQTLLAKENCLAKAM